MERGTKDQGGKTLDERVKEEGEKCWGSVAVVKDELAEQPLTSELRLCPSDNDKGEGNGVMILWRHVSYTEMSRQSK